MPAIRHKKVYGPLNGGLNDRLSPIMIKDSEATSMKNFQVSDRAILEKVAGYQTDHSPFPDDTDSFIRFLLNYKKGATVDVLLMGARDDGNTNSNYKVDLKKTTGDGTSTYVGHTAGTSASFTNGNTAVSGVGTSWSSHLKAGDKIKATAHADGVYGEIQSVNSDTSITLTAGYGGATVAGVAYTARIILHKDFVPRGVVFNNKAIITNGSERPMTFDNDTLNKITDTDAPAAYYIETHKSRVFMASTQSYGSRVFWSYTNDESTWDATSYEDVFPQDNGNIVAIKSFGDSLVVFKNNGKIYQMVGNFDQTEEGEVDFIRKVDIVENIGTILERSVVIHDNFLYFMTNNGLYRLDPRMFSEKVSYGADDFISGVSFATGPTSNKSHVWSSNSQWDAGTHTRTVARQGVLRPYFDSTTISDLNTASDTAAGGVAYSCDIDSSNNVHIAYVNTAGNIIYKKWGAASNEIDTTTTISSSAYGTCAVVRVRSDGEIGVAYTLSTGGVFYKQTSSAVFGSEETVAAAGTVYKLFDILFLPSAGECRVLGYYSTGSQYSLRLFRRSSGTWADTQLNSSSDIIGLNHASMSYYDYGGSGARIGYAASLHIDGISVPQIRTGDITSSGTGDTGFGTVLYSYASASADNIKDRAWSYGASNGFTTYFTNATGTIVTQNVGTVAASANASFGAAQSATGGASAATPWFNHYAVSSAETFKEDSNAITDSSTTTVSVTGYGLSQMSTGLRNNGRVCAVAMPSSSAGSFLVRRLTRTADFTSDERSDATLSAWGTFETVSTTNNATVAHTIAVASSSPPTSYNTILNGQIISSDASKIYVKHKVAFTMTDFTVPIVTSVTLNYVGTGVDSKQPVGISFDTELYYALAETGDSANAHILLLDSEEKLVKFTHPVSTFERFKNKLYAGKSTKGDLIILRQGYNFGSASTAYAADFQSREDFLDAIELEKDIYKFYVLYEVQSAGSFDFSYRLDNFATPGGSDWTTTTVNQTSAGVAQIDVKNKARSIQFRVENDNVNEQVGIIAVVLVYGYLNIR